LKTTWINKQSTFAVVYKGKRERAERFNILKLYKEGCMTASRVGNVYVKM